MKTLPCTFASMLTLLLAPVAPAAAEAAAEVWTFKEPSPGRVVVGSEAVLARDVPGARQGAGVLRITGKSPKTACAELRPTVLEGKVGAFTYALWVRAPRHSTWAPLLCRAEEVKEPGNLRFVLFGQNEFRPALLYQADGAVVMAVGGPLAPAVEPDTWIHYAVVFDGQSPDPGERLRFYTNGKPVAVRVGSGSEVFPHEIALPRSTRLMLGADFAHERAFEGSSFGEVVVLGRALRDMEIRKLVAEGAGSVMGKP